MLKVGIIGVTGYSGQELINLLLSHPNIEITCLVARFGKELQYSDIYPRFKNRISLLCKDFDIEEISEKCELVFLALPHTVSMTFADKLLKKGIKVIDLSADYRLPKDVYEQFYKTTHIDESNIKKSVYGLPEINRDKISKAKLIANPGCYPTSVILALLPIIKDIVKLNINIIVDSKSGTTGAGRKADVALSFSELDENFKCYKANVHQHIPEMEYILGSIVEKNVKVNFVPHLLPLKRGILSTIYLGCKDLQDQNILYNQFLDYFDKELFVRIRPLNEMPNIQDVYNTNFCDIGITVARGMLVIVSVIDNMIKGDVGQAIQNMNIMSGFDEKAGLI